MAITVLNTGRHAERVFDVVRSGFGEENNDVVARSWRRCLDEYLLHPDRPRELRALEPSALHERLARMATLVDCARHEMATLFQQLADQEAAVVLTDTDGVILHMVASPEFSEEVAPLGLRPGVFWSETEAGTNGMGTCLAAAAPVAVRREDHFYTQYTGLTCSAVPVYNPAGEMAAVLDVSSRSSLMQQHLLVLLGMTARMIENRLIDQCFRHAHPVHFHSRPEFVYTLHEGRLAVSDDGHILAANRSALFQLGLQSVADIRSRRIEDIFQTSQEDLLHRSTLSSFHPVVTYRAHASHRFFAVMRRPAFEASALQLGSGASSAQASAPGRVLTPTRTPLPRPLTAPAAPVGPTLADPTLARQLDVARRVIARQTPVLLCGETGSGKEVFARAVHEGSPRSGGAFVAVNCASLPESLIESELFGYRAGAFTGAQRNGRRGKILQADGGTLFLDEIGDMPLELQARLLRVLEERQVTPLGAEETVAVDFQLLSASYRNLMELVESGRFREDLYYRLAGVEVRLPALRERSDRAELIRSLLLAESGGDGRLSGEAEQLLMAYAWPGNVRQLRHALRSACALADGAPIRLEHLPVALQRAAIESGSPMTALSMPEMPREPAIGETPALSAPTAPHAGPATAGAPASNLPVSPTDEAADDEAVLKLNPIQANERQMLLKMLEQHRWNVSSVAKAFDVSRNTLYRRLHKLHIRLSHTD
ncbi:sigma-54-dependent Fis family transcriptional regulator [Leptothrix discophora]|uniref:Sigma-54-dependent Fis family transcriptional regulator n=1 Tax=Leptothrix discophora TaxID=89 RepID=A0ABT9G8E9_LEPDI|nr:sigma-54-dependent Fis family transcriptional regulator [Leptothrix discophora]MDP4302740.1 sigma-54-dependent Fis family transcriptional regulator [Leptothrix discophora]